MIDLRCGNTLDVLKTLPDESVHCVVTSPPYWGLRSYSTVPQVWQNGHDLCVEHEWTVNDPLHKGQVPQTKVGANTEQSSSALSGNATTNTCLLCHAWRGELGLEPTPEAYCAHLVQIFREVKRVLRSDGTLFLNLGDSYAGSGERKPGHANPGLSKAVARGGHVPTPVAPGLKPKDLVGIPWMVAFALRADGWYLRSDIIWHKPNPMPESVRDRPTKAHEYIFLLSKSPKYYYDSEAIAEQSVAPGSVHVAKDNQKMGAMNGIVPQHNIVSKATRNKRSVWTITTKPFRGAHFATFPPDLIRPMILAGTSERGVCRSCGAPWERVTEREPIKRNRPNDLTATRFVNPSGLRGAPNSCAGVSVKTTGWRATCTCDAGEPIPATVMDIFNGAGTTGVVALTHNRNYIGIDLNPAYIEMARERIAKVQPEMVTR